MNNITRSDIGKACKKILTEHESKNEMNIQFLTALVTGALNVTGDQYDWVMFEIKNFVEKNCEIKISLY